MTSDEPCPGATCMPALGRAFVLGQMYDCRSEKIIEGKTLWSTQSITEALNRHPKKETQYSVCTDNSFEGKMMELGIPERLQLSVLCNMVPLRGSSKYLEDRTGKIALKYTCTSAFEEVDMERLKKENVQFPEAFADGIATHVVCGILSGGQAIFTFERGNSLLESDTSLEESIQALPKLGFDKLGRINISKDLEEEISDVRCQLYSDFKTPYNPRSYKEAATLLKSFKHFVEGSGTPPVPLSVWLYPLKNLNFRAAKIVNTFSLTITSQIQTIMKHIKQTLVECDDLTKSITSKKLFGIRKDIEAFQQSMLAYTGNFQNEMKSMVKRIRSGSVEDNVLEKILDEKENSPFAREQIDIWIKHKFVQMKILSLNESTDEESKPPVLSCSNKSLSTSFSSTKTSFQRELSTSSLPCILSSEPHPLLSSQTHARSLPTLPLMEDLQTAKILVCFHVSVGGKYSQTKLMEAYLEHLKSGSLQSFTATPSPQYYDHDDSTEVLKKADQFKDFVEANRHRENVHFTYAEDNDENVKPNVYITVHDYGFLCEEDFQPPSAPSAAKLVSAAHDQITIKWKKPCYGGRNLSGYEIIYKNRVTDQEKAEVVDATTYKFTLTHLDLGTEYDIQLRAVCRFGTSQWSPCATLNTLPASPPGKPIAKHIPTGVQLQWKRPNAIARHIFVRDYTVMVFEVSRGVDFEKKSDPQNREEMTISHLNPTSTYAFRVRANLDNNQCTELSQWSESLEPTPNALLKAELVQSSKVAKSKQKSKFVRQLNIIKTHVNSEVKIRKCELGKTSDDKTEKVIMVVGATGAGKTTLINGLVNYVMGVVWEDDVRFQLILDDDETKQRSQAHSQTRWVTSYTLHHRKGFTVPYTITVIDSPGFGDTSGIKRDKEITEQIRTFFTTKEEGGIDHIDAIGFVIQASLPRLTASQRFIYDSVLSLFGKDISDNIFLLLTFADGQSPPVLDGVNEAGLPFHSYFKFNNSALYVQRKQSNIPEGKDRSSYSNEFDQMFWEMVTKSFENFTQILNNTQSKSLVLTKDVLNERHSLEAHVTGIHKNIRTGLTKLDQLKTEKDVLKNHEKDIDLSKDFTYVVKEEQVKVVKIPSGTYITNCIQCNFTCHYPCKISDDSQKNSCAAMDKKIGVCKICPGKCPWDVHKNMSYKYEIDTIERTKTSKELKARYEDASGKRKTAEELIKHVAQEFEQVQVEVLLLTNKVRQNLSRLKEIALKPDPLSMVGYIDVLIESEKSQSEKGWKDRLQQLNEVRKYAEVLQQLAKEDYDPFAELNELYSELKKEHPQGRSLMQNVMEKIKSFVA